MSTNRPLTRVQLAYLRAVEQQGTLTQGWGGYASTLTIRLLEERGMVTVRWWARPGRADEWTAQITNKGRDLLEKQS